MRIVVAIEKRSIGSALGMLIDAQPDLELAGDVGDLTDLLVNIKAKQPDVVVLDWDAFEKRIESLQDLLGLFDEPPLIIALSVDEQARSKALASGVHGFAYKGNPPSQLLDAIRDCIRNENHNEVNNHSVKEPT